MSEQSTDKLGPPPPHTPPVYLVLGSCTGTKHVMVQLQHHALVATIAKSCVWSVGVHQNKLLLVLSDGITVHMSVIILTSLRDDMLCAHCSCS